MASTNCLPFQGKTILLNNNFVLIESFQEPTALLQFSGGPCAVLAPLQAFLIRRCLENKIGDLSSLTPATVTRILVEAMCDILKQSSKDENFVIARVSQDVAQIIQV